ncbi:MAG TPA: hypothetical protein VHA77_15845 [Xanthobacteraceae bacterium]|jgi:hypothetical protein|nr:hypothetical protein [Xanthobacteraceae bacterium]
MGTSDDYLAHAAACLRRARTIKDPRRRASFIEMAVGWLRMTEQQSAPEMPDPDKKSEEQ